MHHRFSLLLLIIYSLSGSVIVAQSSLAVNNTSVFVGEGTNMAIYGDVYFNSDEAIINEGTIDINALSREISMQNNSNTRSVTGTGDLVLLPENNITISGADLAVSKLTVNGCQNVNLQVNLTIEHELNLQQGRILGNGFFTSLAPNTGTIIYNNSEDNTSYIIGDLRLHGKHGANLNFPVGDETHFHPITISNYLEQNEWIQVNYSPADITAVNPNVVFLSDYWWNISLENSGSNGFFNAEISSFNFDLSNLFGNIYIAPIHCEFEGITTDLPYFFENEFQSTNKEDESFSLADIQTPGHFNIADISALRIVMPNYLRMENNTDNFFVIPNIDLIGNAELTIFSRLGNVILEKKDYQNDFDFSSYPRGTYYYTIDFEIQGKSQSYQSFIEII